MFKDLSKGALVIIGVVVFTIVVSLGIWGFNVAFSGPKGAGDQEIANNSAGNRTFAQGHFHDLYAEVIGADQKLDQAKANMDAFPGDAKYVTEFTGLQSYCIDVREQYNADSKKATLADWKDGDLPHELTDSNPDTDCKENPEA